MRISRKTKSLFAFSLFSLLLLGSGIVVRNFLLNQIKRKIQAAFDYSHLRLSLLPPSLIIEDIRTTSLSPFFSAKKVTVKISYPSLLTKERPLNVFIEEPVLRIFETLREEGKKGRPKLPFPLPFEIERGVIKGGEVYFWGKKESFHSSSIKAIFTQKKNYFSLQAEAEENIFFLSSARQRLEGRVKLLVEGRGQEIVIKRIALNGSDFRAKAEGRLINPSQPELQLRTSLELKTGLIASFFNLPFEWQGEAEGKGLLRMKKGEIVFATNFESQNIILNRVPLGTVRGQVHLGGEGGTIEFNIQKRASPQEFVRIDFSGKRVEGLGRGFHLDPIMNYVALPWPVKSAVWGNFTIKDGKLEADAEFQDESLIAENHKFPFRGRAKISWDGKKEFTFSSQGLQSSFAVVDVEGKAEVNENLAIAIQGETTDLKEAREFVSLILSKKFDFPEIRGKGKVELQIFGDYSFPQVKARFSLSPAGFDKFEANQVEGVAEISRNKFQGVFNVNDQDMKGEIRLLAGEESVEAKIQVVEGSVERILPGLDIPLPLQGQASGNFEVKQRGKEDVEVQGEFSGSLLSLWGQNLKDVRGKLVWKEESLSFPEIQFHLNEGLLKGKAQVAPESQEFDIDISAEEIDLSTFYPQLEGKLGFNLRGAGLFGRDLALGKFAIKGLDFAPFEEMEASGEAELGYTEDRLTLKLKGNFFPGDNDFLVTLGVPFQEKTYSVDVKGSFANLDLLLPWTGAKGRLNYLGQIQGGKSSPQISGVIDFQGTLLPFPKFAHAVTDYSGLIFVQNSRASIRSFQGKLGGGDIQGSGEVRLGKRGFETINISCEGKNLLLSPLERTRALADGSLRLIKDNSRFALEGSFFLHRVSWRRELYEKFVFYSSPYYETRREPSFFEDLTLDIGLKADDNAWMENSLGRIKGRFDLTITGNVNAPIILGNIEALAGDVYFQDRKFKILKGEVSFFNPLRVEPYLDFKGETYVKDYRVSFSLTGLVNQLKPEFNSSPPLPPEDVLALLALGEAFKRTTSLDTSAQLSTASLLSFQIAEEAKKRAEKLFNIDRFRIDPFIMGSSAEMTARLTVGKKVSRNLFILYSTNLTTQREEIVRLEWELSDDFSVVGVRDELGRISFDVKIRKRF